MTIQQNLTQEDIQAKVEHIFASRFNHTLHAYIDITGDLVAGTLLSQIMYWFADGKNRPTVNRDGYWWIAKRREDWMSEIRITSKQYDRAIKILTAEIEMTKEEKEKQWNKGKRREKRYDKEKRLVEVKTFQFHGQPMLHIRPISENINREIRKWKDEIAMSLSQQKRGEENPNCQSVNNGNYQKVNMEIPNEGNSYNIYNNTNNNTENTNRDYNTKNTDKYTLEDVKRPSSKGNMYTSVPEKQEVCGEKKQNRYIPEDYTEEQLIEHIYPVVVDEMDKQLDDTAYKPVDEFLEVVKCFHRKYMNKTGKRHRVLADVSYREIVRKFLNPPEDMVISENSYDPEIYEDMIDKYFRIDMNKYKKKFKGDITKSLSHFMCDKVREYIYDQLFVYGEYVKDADNEEYFDD